MITLQQLVQDIQSKQLRKFYVFTGTEYGIKTEYVNLLKSCFTSAKEVDTAASVISASKQRSLFKVDPKLFIVRYDTQFLSDLNAGYARTVLNAHINGTLLLIYEDDKAETKCDKFFPDNVVHIPLISKNKIAEHLQKLYSTLPTHVLKDVAIIADNYGEALSICKNLSYLEPEKTAALTQKDIQFLAGKEDEASADIKLVIASKNYKLLFTMLSKLDPVQLLQSVLSTMIDLERAKTTSYKGDYASVINKWKLEDIYNLFMITFDMLNHTRLDYNNVDDAASTIIELLGWQHIPSPTVLVSGESYL